MQQVQRGSFFLFGVDLDYRSIGLLFLLFLLLLLNQRSLVCICGCLMRWKGLRLVSALLHAATMVTSGGFFGNIACHYWWILPNLYYLSLLLWG
jgi:hypothetical protein